MEKKKRSYLYLLRHDTSYYHKIGWTFDIPNRISELQIGNPMPLILIDSCECDSEALPPTAVRAKQHEDYLKKEFATYRLRGEWFRLEEEPLSMVRDYFKYTDIRRSYYLIGVPAMLQEECQSSFNRS